MINILIIEDENAARNKLKRFLSKLDEETTVVAEIEDLKGLQTFLKNPTKIDVVISDIELRDGNVFSYLEQCDILCPIIFTTAYNQFWTNAFEGMGIDYLLKPYNFARFQKAWDKFKKIAVPKSSSKEILSQLESLFKQQQISTNLRERFTYKKGNGIAFIATNQITLIKAEEGAIFIIDENGKRLLSTENGLQQLFSMLDEKVFFRINRSEIVHKKYIEQMQRFSKNVIAIKVTGIQEWLKTSQSNTSEFNDWVKM